MSKEYDPKKARDLLSPGMVSIFVLSEEIEHSKVQLAMCFQNSIWQTQIPRYPKKHVFMISQ